MKGCRGHLKWPPIALTALPSNLSPSPDGARVASSTGIDILLLDDFKLVINDTTHLVRPPRRGEDGQRGGREPVLFALSDILAVPYQ